MTKPERFDFVCKRQNESGTKKIRLRHESGNICSSVNVVLEKPKDRYSTLWRSLALQFAQEPPHLVLKLNYHLTGEEKKCYKLSFIFSLFALEIPDFLTDTECQQIIDGAKHMGLDTSEVQDPETGINIEPNTKETFRSWDYNKDGVVDKTEVT